MSFDYFSKRRMQYFLEKLKDIFDTKVDKVSGKGLSTNDYTTTEKNKLAGIATGAEVNVQSDWNQTTTTADDYIKNKPTSKAAASGGTDVSLVTTGEKYTWNNKVDKVTGKGLSTNDYTNEEKTKLAGITAGAEPNVQSDWKQSDSSSDDFIKNKPTSDIKTSEYGQFLTVTGGLLNKCEVELTPIQSGSGTPSPTNVRPISGHTQVQVGNMGKNKLKVTATSTTRNGLTFTVNDDGSIKISGTATANTYFYPFGGTIPSYLVGKSVIVNGSASGVAIRIWHYNGTNSVQSENGNDSPTVTISTTSGAVDAVIWNGTTVNTTIYPMLRLATETDPTYKPFNGYTTTINLGGTYYGGTLDAVSGVLTVTHGFATFNGNSTVNVNYVGSSVTQFLLPQIPTYAKIGSTLSETNELEYSESTGIPYIFQIVRAGASTPRLLFTLPNSIATTIEEASTWLASNPLQIAYELATPQTIQLDPQTLETLVGQNDVFAPLVGQSVEEVEYREVLAIDDVPKAIPYENVAPDMGTGEDRTYFRIKKYGRLVQLEFIQSNYWMVVEQQTKVVFGVLPDGYYDKQPSSMLHPDVEFEYPFVNETATNQYDNKKLFINMVNGEVYSVYQANDEIHPMGSITYILDHD